CFPGMAHPLYVVCMADASTVPHHALLLPGGTPCAWKQSSVQVVRLWILTGDGGPSKIASNCGWMANDGDCGRRIYIPVSVLLEQGGSHGKPGAPRCRDA